MAERPIIFNSEMVRAILAGRKTQTRRVIKPQPRTEFHPNDHLDALASCVSWIPDDYSELVVFKNRVYQLKLDAPDGRIRPVPCPYGKPGDLLWVKETHAMDGLCGGFVGDQRPSVIYRASDEGQKLQDDAPFGIKWRPSIYMPKWAVRSWLKVTDVRVERVQDISEEDAQAEGCKNDVLVSLDGGDYIGLYARERFEDLWDSINKKRGFGWDVNPWVWVIEFERVNHD